MTASDHLNGQQFYHGSRSKIEPGESIRSDWRSPAPAGTILPDNFFTTDRSEAEKYTTSATHGRTGAVHVVEPTGPYEPDETRPNSFLSQHPLRVVKRLGD